MQRLGVDYATITAVNGAGKYYWQASGGGYDLFVVTDDFLLIAAALDADATDFEAHHKVDGNSVSSEDDALALGFYKDLGNALSIPKTKDGREINKPSTANRCTNFNQRPLTFYTAKPGSLHNVNPVTNADWADATLVLYNADGSVSSDGAAAVKTVVDWEPHYNFEIIAGKLDIPLAVRDGTTDLWWFGAIGVPDYPPMYYGQIPYIGEVNLEAAQGRVTADGRSISFLPYNLGGYPHTNKMRFYIKHPSGEQQRFQIYIDHYV